MGDTRGHAAGRLSGDDLVAFNIQLQNLVKSGLPMAAGLRAFAADLRTGRLKTAVQGVVDDIDAGESLPKAVENRRGAFPGFYVVMIRAGAKAGRLDVVLGHAGEFLASRRKLAGCVSESILYPVAIVILSIVVLVAGSYLLSPTLREIGENIEGVRFWDAKGGIGMSRFGLPYVALAAMATLAVPAILFALSKALRGWSGPARFMEWLVLSVPFLGRHRRSMILAQFASTLGVLLDAGVPTTELAEALEAASPSPRLRRAVRKFLQGLQEGESTSDALCRDPFLRRTFLFAAAKAETSGRAGEAFLDAAAVYSDMAEHYARLFLSGFLTPVLGIVMIAVVAGTLVSLYGPVLAMIGRLSELSAHAF